jgi:hypothetical protein
MRMRKTVVTDKPLGRVFDYLSDFTTTTDWEPGTVATVRQQGDGGVGTTYLNSSEFLGTQQALTAPGRLRSIRAGCPGSSAVVTPGRHDPGVTGGTRGRARGPGPG